VQAYFKNSFALSSQSSELNKLHHPQCVESETRQVVLQREPGLEFRGEFGERASHRGGSDRGAIQKNKVSSGNLSVQERRSLAGIESTVSIPSARPSPFNHSKSGFEGLVLYIPLWETICSQYRRRRREPIQRFMIREGVDMMTNQPIKNKHIPLARNHHGQQASYGSEDRP
jgi:hypothetical protein